MPAEERYACCGIVRTTDSGSITLNAREFNFQNRREQLLLGYAWEPSDRVRGRVVVCHGYAEHAGRYGHVAAALVQAGFAVHAVDLSGHGRSEGHRADVHRFEDFVNDLEDLYLHTTDSSSPASQFLLGHSMGGLIALHFALRDQSRWHGLLLSAAAVQVAARVSPAKLRAARLIARFLPRLPVEPIPLESISRDPDARAAYDTDPLMYRGRTRARLGVQMLDAAAAARERLSEVHLPVWIAHGTGDTLIDPAGSSLIHERVQSTDKTLKCYEGLYHEIFNEPEKELILEHMVRWLDARCPS